VAQPSSIMRKAQVRLEIHVLLIAIGS